MFNGQLLFFALPLTSSTSDQYKATRLVDLGMAAHGKRLTLTYMYSDESARSFGCDVLNCPAPRRFWLNR